MTGEVGSKKHLPSNNKQPHLCKKEPLSSKHLAAALQVKRFYAKLSL
jgi:hypothetical protein